MFVYPDIDPIAFSLGPIQVAWYGLMYLLGFVAAYWLAIKKTKQEWSPLAHDHVEDLIFYSAIGVIIGGRLGYMFFYGTDQLINNPLSLFYIWQGGLSFHGGLVGVITSLIVFCKKKNIEFLRLMDGVALAMPIGLGLVRVGNFLNGELYGKATNGDWGFVFPTDPFGILRHPSQLYESFGEGLLLFAILFFINSITNIVFNFIIYYVLIVSLFYSNSLIVCLFLLILFV